MEFCDVHTSEIVNDGKQMTHLAISANGFLDTNSTIFTHSLVHLSVFILCFCTNMTLYDVFTVSL